MNTKRILSLILAALMLVPALASCDKDPSGTKDTDTSVNDTTPADTEPAETGLVLAKTDFGGTELRVMGVSEEVNFGYYATKDIWREEDSADPYESAIYQRVQDCIEKYNFTVTYVDDKSPINAVASMVSGGLDQVDLVFHSWGGMYIAAKGGNVLDLREVSTIDLSGKWWDQNANEQLSIANRLFYTTGELTTIDDRCTRALYFNKALAAAHDMESPYELVRTNQWTFDKFAEMCRSVYDDVDGDGELGEDDVVGMFTEPDQFSYLMTAAGEKYAELDDTGLPVYTWLQNAEAVTKMETIAGFLIEDNTVFSVNSYTSFGSYTNKSTYARSKFAAGKHLFSMGGALVITEFADMEDPYGIIPMPKWSSDQTRYYHIVEASCPMFGIPNTKADASDIGYMLEYFSYEGMNTLTPTYKEKMLKRRYAQDTDSADMLDIIYANKCFDIGYVGKWGNVTTIAATSISAGKMPSMTTFNRVAKSIPKLIQKDYDAYLVVGRDVE